MKHPEHTPAAAESSEENLATSMPINYRNNYCCCCCCVTSVVSDSVRPHRQQPTRLLRPWDFPSKSTGVGCHCLLRQKQLLTAKSAPGPVSEARDSKMQNEGPLKTCYLFMITILTPIRIPPQGILESSWSLIIIIMAYLLEASILLQD